MSLPTPAAVREAITNDEQSNRASYDDAYADIIRQLAKIDFRTCSTNDNGKLCAERKICTHVLDDAFVPWLCERLARDNPAWNVTVYPSAQIFFENEPYRFNTITMVEK